MNEVLHPPARRRLDEQQRTPLRSRDVMEHDHHVAFGDDPLHVNLHVREAAYAGHPRAQAMTRGSTRTRRARRRRDRSRLDRSAPAREPCSAQSTLATTLDRPCLALDRPVPDRRMRDRAARRRRGPQDRHHLRRDRLRPGTEHDHAVEQTVGGRGTEESQDPFASMTSIEWFNHHLRLHGTLTDGPDYTTPAAHEAAYYRETAPGSEPVTRKSDMSHDPGRFILAPEGHLVGSARPAISPAPRCQGDCPTGRPGRRWSWRNTGTSRRSSTASTSTPSRTATGTASVTCRESSPASTTSRALASPACG